MTGVIVKQRWSYKLKRPLTFRQHALSLLDDQTGLNLVSKLIFVLTAVGLTGRVGQQEPGRSELLNMPLNFLCATFYLTLYANKGHQIHLQVFLHQHT